MNFFVFVLSLIGMLLGFIFVMARTGLKRRDLNYNDEDTELIQELNRNLVKMEQRIEALETLLADRTDTKRPPTYREVMQQRENADL